MVKAVEERHVIVQRDQALQHLADRMLRVVDQLGLGLRPHMLARLAPGASTPKTLSLGSQQAAKEGSQTACSPLGGWLITGAFYVGTSSQAWRKLGFIQVPASHAAAHE